MHLKWCITRGAYHVKYVDSFIYEINSNTWRYSVYPGTFDQNQTDTL